MGKGTCELSMHRWEEAIKTFTLGIETDLAHVCYEKRAICHYERKHYPNALKDLEQASLYDNYYSSTVHYYKGMIHYLSKNFT